MKKKRNILCSIILAAILLVTTLPTVYSYELNENPEEEELVEILTQLGIIDASYEDLKDDAVTRGQLVKLALKAAGYDESWFGNSSEQVFLDVFADNENYLYINYAYENGIVNGCGNGTFRADDEVTCIEAVAIAMRAFGYKIPAEASGGYESAYANIGMKQGFFKGIEASLNEGISYADAVRMMYNALNANVVKISGSEYFLDDSETYFNTIYGIYGFEGIVEQNSAGGLYESDAASSGYIIVDGEEFLIGASGIEPIIGTNVKIYYNMENDEKKIVYFVEKNTSTLTIDCEDAQSLTSSELQYYTDGKISREKISAKAITIINNVPTLFSASNYTIPSTGEITLIDNNNDSNYDVVKITDAQITVVSQIDYTNEEIFSKYTSVDKICVDDYKNCVVIKKDGSIGQLSDIAAYDMIKVIAGADCHRLEIHILTELRQVTVAGLSETTTERGDVCYEIESDMKESFTTAASFTQLEEKVPELGYSYLFYLDEKGRIAAISSEQPDGSYEYGYLINCATASNLSSTVQVKIYTDDGEFKIFNLRDKIVTGQGEAKIASATFAEQFDTPQIIRYSTNDEGEIRAIEYAQSSRDAEGFRVLGKITETTARDNTRYYKSSGLMGGRFAIAPKTRVFIVPSDDEIDNEDKYYTYDYTYFGDQRYYPSSVGYGSTSGSLEADVVVRRWSPTTINTDALVLLFTKFQEEYNAETGFHDNYLYGYLNGKLMKYKMAASLETSYTTVDEETVPIESGDCIRVAFNPDNEADTIKLIFDASENRVYGNNDTDDTATRYGSQFRCIYGKFEKRYGNYYSFISYNDTEASEDVYDVNTAYVYIVDMSKTGKYRFTVSDKNSISTVEENPGDAMNIFMFYNYSTAKIAVLYK